MISGLSEVVANQATRLGIKPRELKRFLKFAVVGVVGAIVDFGIFNLLRPVFLNLLSPEQLFVYGLPLFGETTVEGSTLAVSAANSISFIAAIISNFMWNRFWTYPDSRAKSFRRQFTQFFVVSVLGILIRVPIVAATHGWFEGFVQKVWPAMVLDTARFLGDNLALVLAVGIVMFWNFFINRYWTYNDVE